MLLRAATFADVPAILKLERGCAGAAHWSERQYQAALGAEASDGSGRLVLVAEMDLASGLLAFLVARHCGPEWELENVAVAPTARRKGLAAQLLAELVAAARLARSDAVFLEVRESNQAARALYRKVGFAEIGRRKGYYADPPEDAILCRLTLS